jgi:hypothetical protein
MVDIHGKHLEQRVGIRARRCLIIGEAVARVQDVARVLDELSTRAGYGRVEAGKRVAHTHLRLEASAEEEEAVAARERCV